MVILHPPSARALRDPYLAAFAAVIRAFAERIGARLAVAVAEAPPGGRALAGGHRAASAVEPDHHLAIVAMLVAVIHRDAFRLRPAGPAIGKTIGPAGATIGDGAVAFGRRRSFLGTGL